MIMSAEQQEFLKQRLAEMGTKCNSCNNPHLIVLDRIFESREFDGGNLNVGSGKSVIPSVILVCSECGDMIFKNAVLIGVLDNSEKRVSKNGGKKK
jgi:hypothetical protein